MNDITFELASKIGPLVCIVNSGGYHVYVGSKDSAPWTVNGVTYRSGSAHLYKHEDGWKAYGIGEPEYKAVSNVYLSRADHKDASGAAKVKIVGIVLGIVGAYLATDEAAPLLLAARRADYHQRRDNCLVELAKLVEREAQLRDSVAALDAQIQALDSGEPLTHEQTLQVTRAFVTR